MKLTNCMEKVVRETLYKIILEQDLPGICICPRCQSDIVALALNNLPPKYVASDTGEVYTRTTIALDYQMAATVYSEVMKAIMKVGANPHHQ